MARSKRFNACERRSAQAYYALTGKTVDIPFLLEVSIVALPTRAYGTVEIRPKSPGVAKLLKYGRVVPSATSRAGMWGG